RADSTGTEETGTARAVRADLTATEETGTATAVRADSTGTEETETATAVRADPGVPADFPEGRTAARAAASTPPSRPSRRAPASRTRIIIKTINMTRETGMRRCPSRAER